MILKKMKILETKQFNAKSEVNKQMQSAGCLFTGGRGRGGRAGLLSQKFCCHHKFAETDFEEEAEKTSSFSQWRSRPTSQTLVMC